MFKLMGKKIITILCSKLYVVYCILVLCFRINNIIDATGASSYHGFLPVLVRSCIQHMTGKEHFKFC